MTAAAEKTVPKRIGIGTVQGAKKGPFGDASGAQMLNGTARGGVRLRDSPGDPPEGSPWGIPPEAPPGRENYNFTFFFMGLKPC